MEFDDYINLVLGLVMIIITIQYIFDKFYRRGKCYDTIPGLEPTEPVLGNLSEVEKSGSLHQFLEELHGKFGDIASFYWQETRVVSICSHEFFKTVQNLFNRPTLIFGNFSEFIGENCIQYCNGIEARNRRNQYDKSFGHQAIIKYITIFEAVGEENLHNMKSPIKSIEDMCFTVAVKSILKACFTPIEKNDGFYETVIALYRKTFSQLQNHYVEHNTSNNENYETIQLDKDKNEFYSIIRTIVNERSVYLEENDVDDSELMLIDQIILYHRQVDKDLIEKEVMAYMIAGFHTTGHALSWCIYYLSANQKCQDRLHEEISAITPRLSNTLECYKAILNMKYLRACINETLRLSQLATYAARVSDEDICFNSFRVPPDTPIILALGVSFTNDKVFPNNEKFLPERFIDNNLPSFSFVPFGFAGKRKCPGERFNFIETSLMILIHFCRFAYLELSILLIQLIGKYSFYLHNPEQEVNKIFGIVTQMKEEVSIHFIERSILTQI